MVASFITKCLDATADDWTMRTMPVKSELFERPASLHSGPALKQNVVVHHRSDLLLEEQVLYIFSQGNQ